MGKRLALVNGIPRMVNDISIYDETLFVVASGAGAGEINGPIAASTPITLPSSKTYTGNELEVYIDTERLIPTKDFTFNSSTSITLTSQIEVGDTLRFRIDRTP